VASREKLGSYEVERIGNQENIRTSKLPACRQAGITSYLPVFLAPCYPLLSYHIA